MNTEWKTLKENPNYEININTYEIRNSKSKKIIKPYVNSNGYYNVTLYKNGKQRHYKLHRLIYNNFLGDLGADDVIDHIDNDRLNNSLENLRKCSQSQNLINSKKTTDFMQIDEKTQESLIVLDLQNEVFFYKELNLFVRKIHLTKFRVLAIRYHSKYCQTIEYRTNYKRFYINVTPYLYPELAENLSLTLIHSDGIYFDKKSRKFYRFYQKSGLFKELKQRYNSKNSVQIHYSFEGKTKYMNVFYYLRKNDSIEVQQS